MKVTKEKFTPEQVRQLPTAQRLTWLRHIRVSHRYWDEVMEKIVICHNLQTLSADPPGLMVVGPAGMGKTSLLKSYANCYPPVIGKEGNLFPIVFATIPSPSRSDAVRDLPKAILYALNDPFADRGTSLTMTRRLIGFFRDCETKLLILDEVQHLYDRDNNKILYNASNWLKTFIKETGVATILVGLSGDTEQVVNINPQLARLFGDPQLLPPFEWDKEFLSLLTDIEGLLPLREVSDLAQPNLAQRCYVACDGIISYLMTLLRGATYEALQSQQESLNLSLLKNSFDVFSGGKRRGIANPFVGEVPIPDPQRRLHLLESRKVLTNKQ